ncbi:MAG: diguanylate cyclase [Treponema sp.]|nr:diguanylate cyclase [Treponema sp.]
MKTQTKRFGYSKVLIVVISVFLLVVNGFLGTVLIIQSRNDLKQQMEERMLDILKSASCLIDGDVLEKLQKEDYDTPEYQEALKILGAFQQSFDLDYIYGIRDMGNKNFTFTVDPDLESPGEFGEPIVYTDALYAASRGTAAVDKVPYEDKWGRFYSAYAPVFNSKGRVSGILAVDVEADWYEKKLREHIITTLVIGVASLLIGGIVVFLVTEKVHKRLSFLNSEMIQLTDDVEELAKKLRFASGRSAASFEKQTQQTQQNQRGDGIDDLSNRLDFVRGELQQYIDDAHELAFTDALTGAGNRSAYMDAIKYLNSQIDNTNPDFSLAVFDINGLKVANDTYGYAFGDLLIITAADVLKEAVGFENLFRIGGDEFVAVMEHTSKEEMNDILHKVDNKIAAKNAEIEDLKTKMQLAVSKGAATFTKQKDADVKSVFRRADNSMYDDKTVYYHIHDRRQEH